MTVLHHDEDLTVLARDQAKVYVVQDAKYAAKDRPELAIETDDIDAVYADIHRRRPALLVRRSRPPRRGSPDRRIVDRGAHRLR